MRWCRIFGPARSITSVMSTWSPWVRAGVFPHQPPVLEEELAGAVEAHQSIGSAAGAAIEELPGAGGPGDRGAAESALLPDVGRAAGSRCGGGHVRAFRTSSPDATLDRGNPVVRLRYILAHGSTGAGDGYWPRNPVAPLCSPGQRSDAQPNPGLDSRARYRAHRPSNRGYSLPLPDRRPRPAGHPRPLGQPPAADRQNGRRTTRPRRSAL